MSQIVRSSDALNFPQTQGMLQGYYTHFTIYSFYSNTESVWKEGCQCFSSVVLAKIQNHRHDRKLLCYLLLNHTNLNQMYL